jgi:peptidoglycan hydrolase-like protein with peptidoglycan-binding domain
MANAAQYLRKGMRDPYGERTRQEEQSIWRLQQGLRSARYYNVHVTGFFDNATDTAVRAFQRRRGSVPDGVATPEIQEALNRFTGATVRRTSAPVSRDLIQFPLLGLPFLQRAGGFSVEFSYSPASMHISKAGRDFIFHHEAGNGNGDSEHLHWPGGYSGVTLGPGYDMWRRTAPQIKEELKDLLDVKKNPLDVAKIAQAAGLGGRDKWPQAKAFTEKNRDLVHLDLDNQKKLMGAYLPYQEDTVRNYIRVHLAQREFDALTSFVGNTSPRALERTARFINEGRIRAALSEILLNVGGAATWKGLDRRRKCEVAFYLNGRCGCNYR